MIEVKARLDCRRLHAWLEAGVRRHLTPDVSNYARGRLRAWLGTEPSLTSPTRLYRGTEVDARYLDRLRDLVGFDFDFCLATFSGDVAPAGIGPHRDASYADYEALSLNVSGQSQFRYWEGRQSFGRSPNTREFDAEREAPTATLVQEPGDLVRFNCKNKHAATPGPSRWNLNFWKAKATR